MSTYPLFLDLTDRLVVVVGGGPVAARRALGAAAAGARLRVISPWVCEDLADLFVADQRHTWLEREYADGDLAGAWLVHTATGDADIDAAVARAAEDDRIWAVRADEAAESAAWTPAVARVGEVTVAVSGGGDPGRARAVRDAIRVDLQTGRLPLRRSRPRRTGPGHVALVGGGPGDPGLLTVRARQLLAQADVVVTDRLGPVEVLAELDPDVEVIDVGKVPGHHPVPQERINQILVEQAGAGKRVVRLKGGDPYVFGRGGEEAIACLEAAISVEVVPGITSAIAVPAAAGIPVTHRGLARSLTIATGHDGLPDSAQSDADTLVLLMGVSRLADTMAALVARGRSPQTPVAIIERGTTPRQRTTAGTIATIADLARQREAEAPAIIVVGDVAALADRLPHSHDVAT